MFLIADIGIIIILLFCLLKFKKESTTALLYVLGSVQGGQIALSVVYFQFKHRLGRPHYMWEDYLYSVGLLEEVEVRTTVCVTVCVV